MGSCAFDALFARSVPHLLERIFFALDFDSFEACSRVNQTWEDLFRRSYAKTFGEKLAEMLIEKQRNERQLWIAARQGNEEEVRRIISSGGKMDFNCMLADPHNQEFRNQETPLHNAVQSRCVEVVQLLLKSGADPNRASGRGLTPLYSAAVHGDVKLARVLLDGGASVNMSNEDFWGYTPLHYAAINGCNEMVRLLLDRGADPNKKIKFGIKTPLHLALQEGHVKYIQLIYMSGSFPKKVVQNKMARAKWATGAGYKWATRLLASHSNLGGARDIAETHFDLPTYPRSLRKVVRRYEEVVKVLLERGADSEIEVKYGSTLLHTHLTSIAPTEDCVKFFEAHL